MEEFYLTHAELNSSDFLTFVTGLNACLETGEQEVMFKDPKGGPEYSYSITELLKYLFIFAKCSKRCNEMMKNSHQFLKVLHRLLTEVNSTEVQHEVVKVLSIIGADHEGALKLCNEFPEILPALQSLLNDDDDETPLNILVASTAEAILVNAAGSNPCPSALEENMRKHGSSIVCFKDIKSLLCVFLQSISSILEGMTHGNISSVFENVELRNQIGLLMTTLRMMSKMSSEDSDSIASSCTVEISNFCITVMQFTSWMFTGHLKTNKGQNFLQIPPTHPLVLFHVVFHEMSNVLSPTVQEILIKSGVFTMMMNEVESLVLIPNQQKGISWFLHISLAIVTNCFLNLNDHTSVDPTWQYEAYKLLCVSENFDYRIPAKLIFSCIPNKIEHSKLVELLDSEVKAIFSALGNFLCPRLCFFSPTVSSRISFTFNQLARSTAKLLKCTPTNVEVVLQHRAGEQYALNVLHEILLETTDIEQREAVIDLVAILLSHCSNFQDEFPMFESIQPLVYEKYSNTNTTEYWTSCIVDSVKTVLSNKDEDLLEDCLNEDYQQSNSLSFDAVIERDRLVSELIELTNVVTAVEYGLDVFLPAVMEMQGFFVIIASFLEFSSSRLFEGIEMLKVPSTTLIRLEQLFILINYVCQKSDIFCMKLGETGVIQSLDNMLYEFNVNDLYYGLPKLMTRLTDFCCCILAVCGCAKPFQGYLRCLISPRTSLNTNHSSTKLLAKCILANIASDKISERDVTLDELEADILIDLLKYAVQSEDGMATFWPIYTAVCSHSLEILYKLCLSLATRASVNIEILISKGILRILSLTFQCHKDDEPLIMIGLRFLEFLAANDPSVKIEVDKNHLDWIAHIEAYGHNQQGNCLEDAFFCLKSLGHDACNTTVYPNWIIPGKAQVRCGLYSGAITTLQPLIQSYPDDRILIAKVLGDAAFLEYQKKRLSMANSSKCLGEAKLSSANLGLALGDPVTVNLVNDDLSRKLDVVMMDMIFNISEKPTNRCLLCRKKCKEKEKLIYSHIWPESLLRAFIDPKKAPGSMKVFDASWKQYGYLQGPGQIAFYMLCKSCENIFSVVENLFKSNFYSVLHNDPNNPSLSTPNKCEIDLSCAERSNWLYLFCLSMIFRVIGLASKGFIGRYGNVSDICEIFNTCRKLLLNDGVFPQSDGDEAFYPKIGLFFTPVHFLSKLNFSPSFMKVIFSMGTASLCTFKLHDGSSTGKERPNFILCSIADINIVAGISKNAFKFVPKECKLTHTTTRFTIPSALSRFLLFPKGLFKEYEKLASEQMSRFLEVSSDRLLAKPNVSWAPKEKELYMKSWLTKSETNHINLNFLPRLFKSVNVKDKFLALLKSPELSVNVVIHYFDSDNTLDHLFILKVRSNPKGSSKLQAFLHLEEDGCDIWLSYELSNNDLSVCDPLQPASKDKAEFFPEIEKKFNTRHRVNVLMDKAIQRAGFECRNQLLLMLHSGLQIDQFDVKCSVPCFYCINVCSVCFTHKCLKTIKIEEVLPNASVCSVQCAEFATSSSTVDEETTNEVSELHLNQSKAEGVLSIVRLNSKWYGFEGGMLTIHLFRNSELFGDSFVACCQIRRPHFQKIVMLNVSKDFTSFECRSGENSIVSKDMLQSRLIAKLHEFI